ncbi:MAG: NUDIX domain-containing protein [SAR324 cluster bacterium]|nr:NUDIX domain-containing protein [SAR324 cluster bacterium]MBL7034169.1 NUDIX domain-containing protein [SAR324 cluster bacterium]
MKLNKFRANVAAVILHPTKNEILMFRRIAKKNVKAELESDGGQLRWNWQFPQGGVDPGETEEETLYRELEEEIGTSDVTIIRTAVKRVRYYYPRKMLYILRQQPEWEPCRGQQQRWFLLRLNCETDQISFKHQPIEFDAFQWISPRKGMKKVVPFKRKAYRKGLRYLGIL